MKRSTIFGWGATAAVALAIVLGFLQAGSPAEERSRRFDEQRVNDLQMISNAVESFYNTQKRLPTTLEEVRSRPDAYLQMTVDPKTGTPYGYRAVDQTRYEICADFETDAVENDRAKIASMPAGIPNFWAHPEGRKCFEITVRAWNVQAP